MDKTALLEPSPLQAEQSHFLQLLLRKMLQSFSNLSGPLLDSLLTQGSRSSLPSAEWRGRMMLPAPAGSALLNAVQDPRGFFCKSVPEVQDLPLPLTDLGEFPVSSLLQPAQIPVSSSSRAFQYL